MLLQYHRAAVLATRNFWKLLLRNSVDLVQAPMWLHGVLLAQIALQDEPLPKSNLVRQQKIYCVRNL
eukprot:scaffold259204_cov23-Tisochrysis_lutea.AAC.1